MGQLLLLIDKFHSIASSVESSIRFLDFGGIKVVSIAVN